MSIAPLFRVDLRRLILLLAVLSALVTLANSFHASYRVQRQLLIDNTLEANRAYAAKLADGTENFFRSTQQQLAYSAAQLARQFDNADVLAAEAERLHLQTNSFNSVIIVDAQGRVRSTSPDTLPIQNQLLKTPGALEALKKRRPLISAPYISSAGNLVLFLSSPVVTTHGEYLGYVGGTLYLKQKSILNNLLGEHYYQDGSYLYAVDQNRRLLYHPDPRRVGTVVSSDNAVIDAVIRDESGSQRVINSLGIDMLAGYAASPTAGWGIVAQRPTAVTLQALDGLMLKVLRHSAPLAILTLLCVWWLARLISRPLCQLAQSAHEMDAPGSAERIQHIRSWYFEAAELKRAMLIGISLLQQRIGKLNLDAQTDPLTTLLNRRGRDNALRALQAKGAPFAVVALDIDHFKRVNDNHGHDAGDQAIKYLAQVMRACSRDVDVLCRNGGEEFMMLLPGAGREAALLVSERLRQHVEHAPIPQVGHMTISLGVALWPEHTTSIDQVLKIADDALYQAKQQGRNCVVLAERTVRAPD